MNETIFAVLGSSVVAAIISGIVSPVIIKLLERKFNKSDRITEIEKKIGNLEKKADKGEKDSVRLQLLFLILFTPKEVHEIMQVAEHYFVELKGNWYATGFFNKWCEDNDVAKPEWFIKHKQ